MIDPQVQKGYNVRSFLGHYLMFRIGKAEEALALLRQSYAKHADSVYDANVKIAEIEDEIERCGTQARADDSREKEFEAIYALEGVSRILVDEDHERITVFTKPILQNVLAEPSLRNFGPWETVNPPPDLIRSETEDPQQYHAYDVGQFEITFHISQNNLSRAHIEFAQNRYRGPYQHRHAQAGFNVCFGPTLNPRVDELMQDLDIASLIHVILSFLRFEITTPTKRDAHEVSAGETPDLGTMTPMEKAGQQETYVEYMQRTDRRRLERVTLACHGRIREEEQKLSSVLRELETDRLGIVAKKRVLASLGERHLRIKERENTQSILDALEKLGVQNIRLQEVPKHRRHALVLGVALTSWNAPAFKFDIEIGFQGAPRIESIPSEHPFSSAIKSVINGKDGHLVGTGELFQRLGDRLVNLDLAGYLEAVIAYLAQQCHETGQGGAP